METVIPPKTVIFSHLGAVFSLDEKIRGNADSINNPMEDNTIATLKHYDKEIREVALTDKKYILTRYTPLIGESFGGLLRNFGGKDFRGWKFMTFFHEDKEIKEKQRAEEKLELFKRGFLTLMRKYDFIIKYTIPYGHTITEDDLKAIDEFWESPGQAETIEEIKDRKPPFPIYSYPVGGDPALQRLKRLQILLAS